MAYKQKGHYGHYSGNAKHSKHHMTNSWEEQDVKRGKEQMKEGHKGHAEALFDDAHGSYNYDGHNSTGSESPASFLDPSILVGDVQKQMISQLGMTKGSRGRMRQQDEMVSPTIDPQQAIPDMDQSLGTEF